jgi:invasion protein IalB
MKLKNIMKMTLTGALLLLTLILTAEAQTPPKPKPAEASKPQAAAAPSKSGPDLTTESYGDWIMKCQTGADFKRCEVSQTILLQGQQAPIALIAVGREKASEPFRLVVQLPNNVTLQEPVKALLPGGEAAGDLRFTRCLPVGCFAEMTFNDAMLSKFKGQADPGAIKFKDGLGREISLPLSLRGFGPAVDALARNS